MASDEHKFNSQVWPTSGHLLNVFFSSLLSFSLSFSFSLSLSLHSLMQAFIYYRGTVHHLDKWYLCPIHTLPIFFLSFLLRMEVFCSKFWAEFLNWKLVIQKSKHRNLKCWNCFSSQGVMAHWIRCPFLDGGLKLEIVFFNKTVIKRNICTF